MSDPRQALEDALEAYEDPTDRAQRNFQELMYTASETGLLEFGVDEEDAKTLFKLFALAEDLRKVPSALRM